MTTIELLKPRYKVIADYPDSEFEVGEIVTGGDDPFWQNYYKEWPHVFKPLAWWEERDVKDLPEYLKFIWNDKINNVKKVIAYDGVNVIGQPLYQSHNKVGYLYSSCISKMLPATKEEYDNWLFTQPPYCTPK